jgi:hypothetical protein
MKMRLACLSMLAVASAVSAAEPLYAPSGYAYFQPQPTPVQATPVQPMVVPPMPEPVPVQAVPQMQPVPMVSGPAVSGVVVPLYPNVRVKDPELAMPCGVTEIVKIPNPCPRSGNCEPVYVPVCVPPGCQPVVEVGPLGQRITYSFGGYRVKVTALRGVVTVDYDRRI